MFSSAFRFRFVMLTLFVACALAGSHVSAQFAANGIEFLSNLPINQIGGGEGNDIWGWVDPQTGNEYALMGRTNGTAMVDVTDGANPIYLGNLPTVTGTSSWRDIKVFNDHAYIVSDSNGPHGVQIFDLTKLRGLTGGTPQTFVQDGNYQGIRSAHNIAINEDSGYAYVLGSDVSGAGLHILDLNGDPKNPTFAGEFAADGYTHDAQIVNYIGPDADYAGREVAFAANEDTLTIVDVTDKTSPSLIAKDNYCVGQPLCGVATYVHQGWLSEDQKYFFMNDELNELVDGPTTTQIYDVSDLDNPVFVGNFENPNTVSTDHNLYVKGNYIYTSNYTTGLRIYEITDPANAVLTEVAWLDTFPAHDLGGIDFSTFSGYFNGAWSNYPYFDDGKIIVSDIEGGLFVVRWRPPTTVDIDFDDDGMIGCQDIDALVAAIAGGDDPAEFDLTGDGVVDTADRDLWLTDAGAALNGNGGAFLLGDANLDGVVDVTDLNRWNTHKFSQDAGWCSGDFNADGFVDVTDLNIWNEFKFQASDTVAVPEPAGWLLALVGVGVLVRRRSAKMTNDD